MRHLAAIFQLTAEAQETFRLACGQLHGRVLALRRNEAVIVLHHGQDQSAGGDLHLGAGDCFKRARPPKISNLRVSNRLLGDALAQVFMNGVVGDKARYLLAGHLSHIRGARKG